MSVPPEPLVPPTVPLCCSDAIKRYFPSERDHFCCCLSCHDDFNEGHDHQSTFEISDDKGRVFWLCCGTYPKLRDLLLKRAEEDRLRKIWQDKHRKQSTARRLESLLRKQLPRHPLPWRPSGRLVYDSNGDEVARLRHWEQAHELVLRSSVFRGRR